MAFDILSVTGLLTYQSVTGLLTYQHHLGAGPTFAHNGLRRAFPDVATATPLSDVA
jgi:hypothetical protein